MELKNRVAFITGAGSGMGATTAKRFAQAGANIVLLDRDQAAIEKLAKALDGLPIACDVSQAEPVEQAIERAVSHFGGIHIVMNCAGVSSAMRIVGREGPMPLEEFNRVIQINLVGSFNVMRLAAHQMIQQDPINQDGERGVVINTASVAAFEGQTGQAAYCASKGGIVSLTLQAAREWSRFGIRVMTIAPGIFETPMMAGLSEEVQTQLKSSVPFPSRLGNPEEYAKLAQQIVENAYLNGSVIRLDAALRMAAK